MTTDNAKAFFNTRAAGIRFRKPNLEDLCYVAGRDPRVWGRQDVYDDLMTSIQLNLHLDTSRSLLEVGCACGFLAQGLASMCSEYTGVDVAEQAVAVAKRLDIPHAKFMHADGTNLPFPDEAFDCALCQDVFINIKEFTLCAAIIREMYRVIRPGGFLMIGCVPDKAREADLPARVLEVAERLAKENSQTSSANHRSGLWGHFLKTFYRVFQKVEPSIVCYTFDKNDFLSLGRQLGAKTEITPVHALNPYCDFRFNAVFTKPRHECPAS